MVKLETSSLSWVKGNDSVQGNPPEPLTAPEVVRRHGVPRKVFREWLEGEVEETAACCSLPFTLFMFVSYAMVALVHDPAMLIRAVEDSLDHDIVENANFAFVGKYIGHKGVHDVNSVADFWSWTANGLLPLVFVQSPGLHEGYPWDSPEYVQASAEAPQLQRGMWLNYNRVVGAMRLQQETSEHDLCPSLDTLWRFYDMRCVRGTGKYELDPEMMDARRSVTPKRTDWLYVHKDLEVLQDQVWELEQDKWYDRKTMKIEIAVPVFNAEFGLHTMLYVNFYMNRGGHIWKKIISLSTFANWHPEWYYMMVDSIWVACIMYIGLNEAREILHIWRKKGLSGIINEYVSFWNALDWFSVFSALTLIVMVAIAVGFTANLNAAMGAVTPLVEVMEQDDQELSRVQKENINLYVDELETTVHYVHKLRLALAFYPLIIVFRLFKAYAAQPRLAIVTNTLQFAYQDLAHFSIVFCSVFLSFAISACVCFGQEVMGYGKMDRAFVSCFRFLLGDFQWEDLERVGRVEAALWAFTFTVVVVQLLLNMLLAVVMDHYVKAKDVGGKGETLWSQARITFTRWNAVQRRIEVPIDKILAVINQWENKDAKPTAGADQQQQPPEDPDDLGPIIKIDDLTSLYGLNITSKDLPLSPDQALKLLVQCVNEFYRLNRKESDMDEVAYLTRKVAKRTKKCNGMAKKWDLAADNELLHMREFIHDIADFTDELRQGRAKHRSEVEQLRAQKRLLLTRLGVDPQELQVAALGMPDPEPWALQPLAEQLPPACLRSAANAPQRQTSFALGPPPFGDDGRDHGPAAASGRPSSAMKMKVPGMPNS